MSDQQRNAKRIIDISVRTMDEISDWVTKGNEKDEQATRNFLMVLRGRMEMCRYDALAIARSVEDRHEADWNNERFRRTDGE